MPTASRSRQHEQLAESRQIIAVSTDTALDSYVGVGFHAFTVFFIVRGFLATLNMKRFADSEA